MVNEASDHDHPAQGVHFVADPGPSGDPGTLQGRERSELQLTLMPACFRPDGIRGRPESVAPSPEIGRNGARHVHKAMHREVRIDASTGMYRPKQKGAPLAPHRAGVRGRGPALSRPRNRDHRRVMNTTNHLIQPLDALKRLFPCLASRSSSPGSSLAIRTGPHRHDAAAEAKRRTQGSKAEATTIRVRRRQPGANGNSIAVSGDGTRWRSGSPMRAAGQGHQREPERH